jgi:hypothetical protein
MRKMERERERERERELQRKYNASSVKLVTENKVPRSNGTPDNELPRRA